MNAVKDRQTGRSALSGGISQLDEVPEERIIAGGDEFHRRSRVSLNKPAPTKQLLAEPATTAKHLPLRPHAGITPLESPDI